MTQGGLQPAGLQPAVSNTRVLAEHQRRQLRSEVFVTYGLLSALMTGFSVCTIYAERNAYEDDRKVEPLRYWAIVAHQYVVRICTALTLFSTFVFMLTTMYTKTALGRDDYPCEIYDTFTEKTSGTRKAAFWSMYAACFLYMASIPCALFYSLHTKQALVGCLPVLGILGLMMYHAGKLYEQANVVFSSKEEVEKRYGQRTTYASVENGMQPASTPARSLSLFRLLSQSSSAPPES
mmetsp:Transcript_58248/g.103479  ORF Transcript_58248/g.103479 Transcript_58248/m.103479 type:complete len:236 (-) Transcript_58248:158-865(-)